LSITHLQSLGTEYISNELLSKMGVKLAREVCAERVAGRPNPGRHAKAAAVA